MRCGPSFRSSIHLPRGRRGVLSVLSTSPRRYIAGLRGRANVGGVLSIVGSLLSGRTVFMGRRLHHACGPGARAHMHLATTTHGRRHLRVFFSRLRHHTPGRLSLLVGCLRLSNCLDKQSVGRISGTRLLRHASTAPTMFGNLISHNMFRICRRRVNHVSGTLLGRIVPIGPLGRRRRHTCRSVLRGFRDGGIYLLRNVATDNGARICVRLVRRAVQRKGRILCLLPRVTLATRVARHLRHMFNSQLNVCRSGFPSTRQIRV